MMPPRPTLMKTGLCNSNNKFEIFINKRHTYIPSFNEKFNLLTFNWTTIEPARKYLLNFAVYNDGLLETLYQKKTNEEKATIIKPMTIADAVNRYDLVTLDLQHDRASPDSKSWVSVVLGRTLQM